MRRKGLIRLWIVLTALWTAGLFALSWYNMSSDYQKAVAFNFTVCNERYPDPMSPGYHECLNLDARHGVLADNGMTPITYVSGILLMSVATSLLITGLLSLALLTWGWVMRGFRGDGRAT